MLRAIFALIIVAHGTIHLMGFLKAFQLAQFDQLSLPISRFSGVFWGMACLLFLASAAAFLFRSNGWWIIAAVGLVVSQILIISVWQDAKFGTIANVIVLGGVLLGYGHWQFTRMVNRELQQFWEGVSSKREEVITQRDLEDLPPKVKQWITNSGLIGKKGIKAAHFKQTGQMRISPEGSWMPVKAVQFVKTADPGFLWIADVKAVPYVHLAGRDKYEKGKGRMLIKLMSLVSVADSKGPKIDQGALLRYLAEMVWYPSTALEDYITWEPIDSTSVRATMRYGGVESSGFFIFDNHGDVTGFQAKRYYSGKEATTLETWVISLDPTSYQNFGDIRVPSRAEVSWKLDEGDFTWYKLEISDLEYLESLPENGLLNP